MFQCLKTCVFGSTSLHHIFLFKPLLLAIDGLLLRITLVLRPINTFVFDGNIFFLEFLGGQHGSTERNKEIDTSAYNDFTICEKSVLHHAGI